MTESEYIHLRGHQLSTQLMHANEFDPDRYRQEPYLASYKLDGLRAIWCPHTKTFFSRQGLPFHPRLTAHIKIESENHTLDGEFYCHGLKLQEINSAIAVTRSAPTEITPRIRFHVFDIVGMSRPADERYSTLHQMRRGISSNAEVVPHWTYTCMNTLSAAFQSALASDYEGLMLKPTRARYCSGRSSAILKWKGYKEMQGKVIDFQEGLGKFTGMLGSLKLRALSGVEFMCGTGWTDEERKHIWNNKDKYMDRNCIVKFLNLSSDGRPKIGTFVKWETS